MNDIVGRLRSGRERQEWGPHYLCEIAADEIERLRAAMREIMDCPQKRHRADGEVEVYYNAATMLKIAKEALEQ